MTALPLTITPTPPISLKLEQGQEGKFSFTVSSLAAPGKSHDVRLQALVIGEDGKGKEVDWLVPGPKANLTMPGGKTETVTIMARPTDKSAPGAFRISLRIADSFHPMDAYLDSAPVACEVVGKPIITPPPPPPRRWWLIPAIVVGVLAVGGGVYLAFRGEAKAALGEACGADSGKTCQKSLLCEPQAKKCLLPGGADCEKAALCASGECDSRNGVCASPLGSTCDPGDKDLVPCPKDGACDPSRKKCLANAAAKCATDDQCVTDKCTGNVCVVKAPALKPGDPCTGVCPDPTKCDAKTKRCVEDMGRPCGNNNQCATGLCEGSTCVEPKLRRDCTADGICALEQKCVPFQTDVKQCLWERGHACTADGECTSRWCRGGSCARDDGRCDGPQDCRDPFQCIAGKNQCFKPLATPCGAHGECDSQFCSGNRCAPSPCPPCTGLFRCDVTTAQCKLAFHGGSQRLYDLAKPMKVE